MIHAVIVEFLVIFLLSVNILRFFARLLLNTCICYFFVVLSILLNDANLRGIFFCDYCLYCDSYMPGFLAEGQGERRACVFFCDVSIEYFTIFIVHFKYLLSYDITTVGWYSYCY